MQCNWKNLFIILSGVDPESDIPDDYEARVKHVIDTNTGLTDRDKTIIYKRWGEHGTLRGIGAELGITSTRVDQLERTLLKKLQTAKVKEYLQQGDQVEVTMESDISYLNLTKRCYSALKKCEPAINTIQDLCSYSELQLLDLHNIGYTGIRQIKLALKEYGFRLAPL